MRVEKRSYTPQDFAPVPRQAQQAWTAPGQASSYWGDAWRRLRRNWVAMAALWVLIVLVLFAFAGPLVVPYGYDQFNPGAENLPPWHYSLEDQRTLAASQLTEEQAIDQARAQAEAEGRPFTALEEATIRAQYKVGAVGPEASELGIRKRLFGYSTQELERKEAGEFVFPHIFGTDKHGRDLLVRTMYATRVSMTVGVAAALLVLVIGATYGAVSGYFGGKVDAVMQRIVEIIYSVPEMLVVLLIATALQPTLTEFQNSGTGPMQSFVTVLGPNLISLFIAFGLLYWVTMSRIIRGQVLQLKQSEYITAARALGVPGGRIIRRHLLPNCIGQIVVTTCLQIPSAIFLESFLSYLGVGVSAPLPSLGSMATDALSGLSTYPYRLVFPAAVLSIMILAFNLFGDGLRDALDPKLKR